MPNVRRMPKRFLTGAPAHVADIFDDPRTFDRYTVVYREAYPGPRGDWVAYRGMSEAPCHPQGFGQMGELTTWQLSQYRHANRRHRICWAGLPDAVKRLVIQDGEPQ